MYTPPMASDDEITRNAYTLRQCFHWLLRRISYFLRSGLWL